MIKSRTANLNEAPEKRSDKLFFGTEPQKRDLSFATPRTSCGEMPFVVYT